MSHLTDAVAEVTTAAERAAYLIVSETDVVEVRTKLEARDYAVRYYRQETGYAGPVNTVEEEREGGYAVMVMEVER